MVDVKNTNSYTYDPNNIAEALMRAMSQNASPLSVKYLNDARKEKVARGGASTAMYENDALTRAADEYVKAFEKSDVSKLHEARRNSLTEGLKNAHSAAKKVYDNAYKAADDGYSEARRLFVADEHKKNLNTEEGLARLGLGRGNANKATSGVGESARVKMLADGAEGLRKLYGDEAKAKADLAENLAKGYSEAYEKYISGVDKTYSDQAEQSLEADKNYVDNNLNLLKLNDTRQASDRDFEYKKQTDAIELDFDKAYKAFEATGVITSEAQAELLGLDVGTQSLEASKVKSEIASDERKLALDENKQLFERAFDVFSETGKVTSQQQAELLGLNVGDTTLDAEKLAFDITYYKAKLENEADADAFDKAYSVFEAVGSVKTQTQADILGIPVGTSYWKYVIDSVKANAAAQNASSGAVRAAATQQNANTNAYKSETDRMELKTKVEKDLKKELQEKNSEKNNKGEKNDKEG